MITIPEGIKHFIITNHSYERFIERFPIKSVDAFPFASYKKIIRPVMYRGVLFGGQKGNEIMIQGSYKPSILGLDEPDTLVYGCFRYNDKMRRRVLITVLNEDQAMANLDQMARANNKTARWY